MVRCTIHRYQIDFEPISTERYEIEIYQLTARDTETDELYTTDPSQLIVSRTEQSYLHRLVCGEKSMSIGVCIDHEALHSVVHISFHIMHDDFNAITWRYFTHTPVKPYVFTPVRYNPLGDPDNDTHVVVKNFVKVLHRISAERHETFIRDCVKCFERDLECAPEHGLE